MTINTYDTILYTALFVVPGFLIDEIIRTIMPQKRLSAQTAILQYIKYSIINLTLWSWLFLLINGIKDECGVIYCLLISLTVILTSVVTVIGIGIIKKKEIIKNIFIKFGIQTKHPIPTAWEYKFSNTNEPKWVIITLSSGKIVRGLYGTSSFSSSDEQFRDIYLQEVYMQKSEGMWEKVDRSDGIWVSPKEISLIEFKN